MGKIYVFVNQKGGVGKTTSAVNIGAYLAEAGKSVLLVDFDSQANLSSGIGAKPPKPGIYELISGTADARQAVRKTAVERLDAIPASIHLSGAAVELIEQKSISAKAVTRYSAMLRRAITCRLLTAKAKNRAGNSPRRTVSLAAAT